MAWTVFIDGKEGTTGLRIFDRLAERGEFSLLTLPEEKRKDADARREAIHAADIAILCLPDAAARESVALAEGSNTRILDTSTAHRIAPGWAYGFPELSKKHRAAIRFRRDRPRRPHGRAPGYLAPRPCRISSYRSPISSVMAEALSRIVSRAPST